MKLPAFWTLECGAWSSGIAFGEVIRGFWGTRLGCLSGQRTAHHCREEPSYKHEDTRYHALWR